MSGAFAFPVAMPIPPCGTGRSAGLGEAEPALRFTLSGVELAAYDV
jgi:hypothetical protein